MEKVGHLRFRQFQGVPFACEGNMEISGPLEGSTIFKAYHLRGKHIGTRVGHLNVRQFQGAPFTKETSIKWAT